MRDMQQATSMQACADAGDALRVLPYDVLPAEGEDILLYAGSVEEITALSKMLSISPEIKTGKVENVSQNN